MCLLIVPDFVLVASEVTQFNSYDFPEQVLLVFNFLMVRNVR